MPGRAGQSKAKASPEMLCSLSAMARRTSTGAVLRGIARPGLSWAGMGCVMCQNPKMLNGLITCFPSLLLAIFAAALLWAAHPAWLIVWGLFFVGAVVAGLVRHRVFSLRILSD
jgi:hypothetical protein